MENQIWTNKAEYWNAYHNGEQPLCGDGLHLAWGDCTPVNLDGTRTKNNLV